MLAPYKHNYRRLPFKSPCFRFSNPPLAMELVNLLSARGGRNNSLLTLCPVLPLSTHRVVPTLSSTGEYVGKDSKDGNIRRHRYSIVPLKTRKGLVSVRSADFGMVRGCLACFRVGLPAQ